MSLKMVKCFLSTDMLLILLSILVLCVPSNYVVAQKTGNSDCEIRINSDLRETQPLIIFPNEATQAINAFVLPEDARGILGFKTNDKLIFSCTGDENTLLFNNEPIHQNSVEAVCQQGSTFKINGQNSLLTSIDCSEIPNSEARYTGRICAKEFKEIAIGFQVSNTRFITQLTICFNDILQTPLYTQDIMSLGIGARVNSSRPFFSQGKFYQVAPFDLHGLYSRSTQRRTINEILGLSANDRSIVKEGDQYFLSRGHYAAKADFVYPAQQSATMWYVNTAPQWQTFNRGNWNTMEIDCRNFAINRKIDLTIITGSYGVSQMRDSNDQLQELYFFSESGRQAMPVPRLYFRVVYDSKNKAGVAFVGINNPYQANSDQLEDIICEDICDQIKWITWEKNNIGLGYSYCCEINDLRTAINFIPRLDVRSVLR